MIVAGIGCRKGTSAGDIGAVIGAALARAGFATKALDLIAEADLAAAGARAETRSERVLALMGIPSVAEAAALAGGGLSARLILPRIAVGSATCALAVSEERS